MRSPKWKLACAGLLFASSLLSAADNPPATVVAPATVPVMPPATIPVTPPATVPVKPPVPAAVPVAPLPTEPSFEYAAEAPRLSLFGLARVHSVSPLSGLAPVGGIHRHPRCDAKDCDPFRTHCRTCDDKSYLALDRTVVTCSPGQNPPNPAKGYIMLGGSPRCNVLIKDPEYTSGTVPQFPAYHPQVREAAKEAAKDAEK